MTAVPVTSRQPSPVRSAGSASARAQPGALQAPGGDRDAAREQGLQDAYRRQLRDDRRLERRERGGVLLRQQHVLLRPHAVLQGILRRARLALWASSGPRDFAPFLRLASARALLTGVAARPGAPAAGTAARGAAPSFDMAGFPWLEVDGGCETARAGVPEAGAV